MNNILIFFVIILLGSCRGTTQTSIQIEVYPSLDKTTLPFHECEIRVNNPSSTIGVFIESINFEYQLLDDKRYIEPNKLRWHKGGEVNERNRDSPVDMENENFYGNVMENEMFYAIFIPPGGSWDFQRHLEFKITIKCDVKWQEMNEEYFCSNILINNPSPPDRTQLSETRFLVSGTGTTSPSSPVPCQISSHNIYSPYCTVNHEDKIPSFFNSVIVKNANQLLIYSDSFILKEDSNGNYSNENSGHKSKNINYNSYYERFSCENFDFCPPENRVFQLYPDIFISYFPSEKVKEGQVIQIDSNGKPKKLLRNKISYRAILHLQKTKEKGFSVTLNNEYSDLFTIPFHYNIVHIKSSDQFMKLMTRAEDLESSLSFSRWNCNWYGLNMRTATEK